MIKIITRRNDFPKDLENLQDTMFRNMIAAGMIYVNEARRVVGVSAGGASKKAKRIRRDPNHEKYEDFRHSKPGEPPRTITGVGRASIQMQAREARDDVKASVTVGVLKNAWYMAYLDGSVLPDLKPRTVAPRPWVAPTYDRARDSIEQALRRFDA